MNETTKVTKDSKVTTTVVSGLTKSVLSALS